MAESNRVRVDDSRPPIFLAGVDRSGIGLLREVLNTHSEIHLSRRTRFWSLYADRFGDLSDPADVRRAIVAMAAHPRIAELGPDVDRLERELRPIRGSMTYGALFEQVHRDHLDRIGKSRWGDKSLNAEMHADRIFREYPNAVMIHVVRDPRDRYASHASHRGIPKGRVGSGTALWLRSVDLARRNQAAFPERYLVIRYEDMVTRPRETVGEVCNFIGESFEPSMIRAFPMPPSHRPSEAPGFPRDHAFNPVSIGRYARDLRPHEIAFIELVARRRMRGFDYDVPPSTSGPVDRLRFIFFEVPVNGLRLLGWWTSMCASGVLDRQRRRLTTLRRTLDERF